MKTEDLINKCLVVYSRSGATGVIDIINTFSARQLDKHGIEWKYCSQCEAKQPSIKNECLCCGSKVEETKHTPGPWRYSKVTQMVFNVSDTGMDLYGICSVNTNNFDANAALITAAPDMLEALKNGLNVLCQLQDQLGPTPLTDEQHAVYSQIQIAIQKATTLPT